MSFVQGSYNSSEEALEAVKGLKAEGYREDQIRLVANESTRDTFVNSSGVDVTSAEGSNGVNHEDESFWDKIVNAFTVEDDYEHRVGQDGDVLADYRSDIDAGKVLVVVDGERGNVSEANAVDGAAPVGGAYEDRDVNDRSRVAEADTQNVELKEEQLDANKREVESGQVNVSKNVVEDRESIDVPVEHDEVVIERHKVEDGREARDGDFHDEDYSIPLTEEQVDVDKKSVVTEEVEVGKRRVTDTEHFEDNVRREELDVQTDGNVNVEKDQDRFNR